VQSFLNGDQILMGAAPASEAAVGDKATSISNLHVGLLGQEPLRTAVVGVDALEPLARQLATIPAKLEVRAARPSLLQRFRSNHHALSAAYERILAGIRAGEPLTSVAEWYLDNFYIIKDVCREVRHDLPRSYYRELQKLAAGPLAGYPRV
jgi:cyclic beta-1,2-glucan synthetase